MCHVLSRMYRSRYFLNILLNVIFGQQDQGVSSQTVSPFKVKCQVQPQVKTPVSPPPPLLSGSLDRCNWLTRQIHWFFSETNYPAVRDLTHKFQTAREFSDFNHTSLIVPLNNPYCLSQAPTLFQLRIDFNPTLAMYCAPALLAVPLTLFLCPGGERKTASRSSDSREQSAWVMISSWNCHWFCDTLIPSLSLSGEQNGQIVWSWHTRTGIWRSVVNHVLVVH